MNFYLVAVLSETKFFDENFVNIINTATGILVHQPKTDTFIKYQSSRYLQPQCPSASVLGALRMSSHVLVWLRLRPHCPFFRASLLTLCINAYALQPAAGGPSTPDGPGRGVTAHHHASVYQGRVSSFRVTFNPHPPHLHPPPRLQNPHLVASAAIPSLSPFTAGL